jgi:hypothetical protein
MLERIGDFRLQLSDDQETVDSDCIQRLSELLETQSAVIGQHLQAYQSRISFK